MDTIIANNNNIRNDDIWTNAIGLDGSALIPIELGGSLQQAKPVVSVMDLGKMLLHCAKAGETSKVHELMSRGAPFTTDWLGTSPLHVAAANNHLETCEVLLRAGIGKDSRTKVDRTPLHFAVYEGHEQIAELLIANKCEIDARDMLKMTPLHWSVEKRHRKITEILLKHGADPTAKSKFNKTPLSIALDTEQTDVFQELLAYQMRMTDPEQQRATDSLVYELNKNRVDDEPPSEIMSTQPDIDPDIIETDLTYSSPEPCSPVFNLNATRNGHERLNGINGLHTMTKQKRKNSIEDIKSVHASTLQMLKDHGISMIDDTDNTLLNSALQSGRKLVLSDAGKLILNDPKFKKVLPTSTPPLQQQPPPLTTTATTSQQQLTHLQQKVDNVRKKPAILISPKSMPLKTNKVIKILSAEEFKQMYSGNVVANSIRKINPTDAAMPNGIKYQTIQNANIVSQYNNSKQTVKPTTTIFNKKFGILPSGTKLSNEIKISGIKQIHQNQLQNVQKFTNSPQPPILIDESGSCSAATSVQNQRVSSAELELESRISSAINPNSFFTTSAAAALSTPSSFASQTIILKKDSNQHPQRSVSVAFSPITTQQSSSAPQPPLISASQPAVAHTPMGLSEIERQLLELKKQTDELRKQLELSQKQNEEYKFRLEKLEQEKELEREERAAVRQYTNS